MVTTRHRLVWHPNGAVFVFVVNRIKASLDFTRDWTAAKLPPNSASYDTPKESIS